MRRFSPPPTRFLGVRQSVVDPPNQGVIVQRHGAAGQVPQRIFDPPAVRYPAGAAAKPIPSSRSEMAGVIPPPTRFGTIAVQRHSVTGPGHLGSFGPTPPGLRPGVVQPASFLKCCCPWLWPKNRQQADTEGLGDQPLLAPSRLSISSQVEMGSVDDRGRLPDWGQAQTVGYHWTACWDKIKSSGQFLPSSSGSALGSGFYICARDHKWVEQTYPNLNTLLEVGYVGDMRDWTILVIDSPFGFKTKHSPESLSKYDVIQTKNQEGPLNQICYRTDGPSQIRVENFRVRKIREK